MQTTQTKPTLETPWGPAQTIHAVAIGLTLVSTAGHGGLILNFGRWAHLKSLFPNFKPYAGENYLEEDCDIALAPLAFPEHYSDEAIFQAVRMVMGYPYEGFTDAKAFLQSTAGKSLMERHDKFKATVAALWERGSMSTRSGGWHVHFLRNGESRTVAMPYPEKQWYSDEELSAFPVVTQD